jgi:SAM-dependent methyltransferase
MAGSVRKGEAGMTAVPSTRVRNASGLLDYYLQHGLNPVHYEMRNPTAHFQRRASLYRSLGLHPVAVRNSRVLEVAVGTGQNSLYLASLRPRHFTLVEPNPVAIRDIKALYSRPEYAGWRPELIECKLEDFNPLEPYDIVVCENWLGRVDAERALIRKLGTLVAPGGLLAITTVSPTGFLPNVLRRLLAIRLGCWEHSFEDSTRILVEAFGPHLATMTAMTRSATDWVHDTVMNPHYLTICLSIPMVLEDLGAAFTFVGSSPSFVVDWRWFKALYGDARDFNGHFIEEYYANCHNFLDHRLVLPRLDPTTNRKLDAAACRMVETAIEVDRAAQQDDGSRSTDHPIILSHLQEIKKALVGPAEAGLLPLGEFEQVYRRPELRPEDVRNMKTFASLFGRETVYIALEKSA